MDLELEWLSVAEKFLEVVERSGRSKIDEIWWEVGWCVGYHVLSVERNEHKKEEVKLCFKNFLRGYTKVKKVMQVNENKIVRHNNYFSSPPTQ